MDDLARALLGLQAARNQLRQCLRGQVGPTSARVLAAAGEVFKAGARLEAAAAAHVVPQLEPVAAVQIAVEAALDAGADWQQLVAAVNRARSPSAVD